MCWSLFAKACMLAYVALLVRCAVKPPPTWTYALFIPLVAVGVYAEYKADGSRLRRGRPEP